MEKERYGKRQLNQMRVLVVDEDGIFGDYQCAMLRRLGIAAERAGNGKEALAALKNANGGTENYDVVFVGCRKPEGIQVLQRIRRETACGIAAVTGRAESRKEMRKAGADYVLEGALCQSAVYHLITEVWNNENYMADSCCIN